MELKKCTTKELATLMAIAQTTYREHYQYLWKDKGEGYIQANYNRMALLNELEDPNLALYFITQDDEVYGFLKLRLNAANKHYSANDALEIVRIYLLKKATGKGLGKKVMATIEAIASARNKKVIWLKAMDSSAAIHFYKNCGYTVSGKTTLNVEGIHAELQGQWIMEKGIKSVELVCS